MRQIDLIPKIAPHVEDVPLEMIRRRPTFIRACHLSMDMSNLEDKQIYGPLDLDPGAFSRIRKGSAWLPQDERLGRFMDITQNEVPLIWLAESRGYDWSTIRKHRSREDRELEEAKQEIADLRRLLSLKADVLGSK